MTNLSSFTNSLTRRDLWITTKVARHFRKRAEVRESVERSLRNLQTYVDLFLIHSPHSDSRPGERGQDVLDMYTYCSNIRGADKSAAWE